MKYLNALQSFLIGLAVLWVGVFSLVQNMYAAAPFTDNFDSYSTGSIINQGNWQYSGTVSNSQFVSSPNSANNYGPGSTPMMKFGDNVANNGEWYFNLYIVSGGSGFIEIAGRHYSGPPYTSNVDLVFSNLGQLQFYGIDAGTISLNEWHTIGMRWYDDSTAQVSIDGGVTWTELITINYATGIDTFLINFQNGIEYYIDDISDIAPVASPTDSITIINPADQSTATSTINNWTVETDSTATTTLGIKLIVGTNALDIAAATATSTDGCWSNGFRTVLTGAETLSIANKCGLAANVSYWVKAFLGETQYPYDVLAVSPLINFTINDFITIGNASTSYDYYINNVPEYLGDLEPTIFYNTITGFFNLIFNPIFAVLQWFNNLFNFNASYNNGQQLGSNIALIFAYLDQINSMFNFPIVTITTILIIIEVALIIWKQTHRAIKTVK